MVDDDDDYDGRFGWWELFDGDNEFGLESLKEDEDGVRKYELKGGEKKCMLHRFGKSTFQEADANNDGTISLDEFESGAHMFQFQMLDTNGDDKLDQHEFEGITAHMSAGKVVSKPGPAVGTTNHGSTHQLEEMAAELKALKRLVSQQPGPGGSTTTTTANPMFDLGADEVDSGSDEDIAL